MKYPNEKVTWQVILLAKAPPGQMNISLFGEKKTVSCHFILKIPLDVRVDQQIQNVKYTYERMVHSFHHREEHLGVALWIRPLWHLCVKPLCNWTVVYECSPAVKVPLHPSFNPNIVHNNRTNCCELMSCLFHAAQLPFSATFFGNESASSYAWRSLQHICHLSYHFLIHGGIHASAL